MHRNIFKVIAFLTIMSYALVNVASAHSLGFAIYTTNSSTEMLKQYKSFYDSTQANSILIDDTWTNASKFYLSYYNQPQNFSRMIIADSNPAILYELGIAQRYNFSSSDYVAYDAEDWTSTPLTEQFNQPYYVSTICDEIHQAGYKCAYTPQLWNPIVNNLDQVNWSKVDFLGLQEQQNSVNQAELIRNVSHMVSIARSENPNIVIYVQLDMAQATAGQIGADIRILSNMSGVDGVILTYLPSLSYCDPSTCNIYALESLVQTIKSVDTSTAITTSTTTTTVSSTTTTTSNDSLVNITNEITTTIYRGHADYP
jgi:hypothetical protein